MRPKFSASREEFLKQFTDRFERSIVLQQSKLLKAILEEFMGLLELDGGLIKPTIENQIVIGQLDDIYNDFIREEGVNFMNDFIRSAKALYSEGAKYYREVSDFSDEAFDRIIRSSRKLIFGAMGYDIERDEFIRGGRLEQIVTDKTPINAIKLELNSAVANSLPILEAEENVRIVTVGNEQRNGSMAKHLNGSMPDPFYQFDRKAGQNISKDLKLDYAIYQGGLIKTSRPFCIVRNNHVYTREEIAKFGTPADQFGGYKNKAAGDFAGKKTPYDPFRDLGGYNCRHALDWISENLAFRLRPELRPPEPQPSGL